MNDAREPHFWTGSWLLIEEQGQDKLVLMGWTKNGESVPLANLPIHAHHDDHINFEVSLSPDFGPGDYVQEIVVKFEESTGTPFDKNVLRQSNQNRSVRLLSTGFQKVVADPLQPRSFCFNVLTLVNDNQFAIRDPQIIVDPGGGFRTDKELALEKSAAV